jgi:hypothetical protein
MRSRASSATPFWYPHFLDGLIDAAIVPIYLKAEKITKV